MVEIYSTPHYRNCLRCNDVIEVRVNFTYPIKCYNCEEVENRLDKYLESENGRKYILELIEKKKK